MVLTGPASVPMRKHPPAHDDDVIPIQSAPRPSSIPLFPLVYLGRTVTVHAHLTRPAPSPPVQVRDGLWLTLE